MNENPSNDAAQMDGIVTDVVDGNSADAVRAAGKLAGVSTAERERVADLLLVNALLEQLQPTASTRNRTRVQRTMAAISQTTVDSTDDSGQLDSVRFSSLEPRLRRQRHAALWWLPMAVAASLLVAASAFLLQPSNNRAYAAVVQAYETALDRTIREYQVTIERDRSLNPVTATLWVKGADQFAFTHPAPLPGNFWIGSDGRERWFVPAVGPVLVSDDPGQPRRWLMQQDAGLPFLQLSTMLSQLRRDYQLRMIDDEHLHGRLQSTSGALPREVDAWIDPASGIVRKLVLQWPADSFKVGPRQITLELTSQDAVNDDWFTHDLHHDSRRAVVRLPQGRLTP